MQVAQKGQWATFNNPQFQEMQEAKKGWVGRKWTPTSLENPQFQEMQIGDPCFLCTIL